MRNSTSNQDISLREEAIDCINKLYDENERQQHIIASNLKDYEMLKTQQEANKLAFNDKLDCVEREVRILKESASRTAFVNKHLNVESSREITSIYQLVRCYYEARGFKANEEDIIDGCQKVIRMLEVNDSEKRYCKWYYDKSIEHCATDDQTKIARYIKETTFDQTSDGKTYDVAKLYEELHLKNYIKAPIAWADPLIFVQPYGSTLFIVLFESHEKHINLLSFPPSNPLTIDLPVKISTAKSSVHIEMGVINLSDDSETIAKTKMNLRSCLLCFKWLNQIISDADVDYGLIGNIYVNKPSISRFNWREEYDDVFTFKTVYEKFV